MSVTDLTPTQRCNSKWLCEFRYSGKVCRLRKQESVLKPKNRRNAELRRGGKPRAQTKLQPRPIKPLVKIECTLRKKRGLPAIVGRIESYNVPSEDIERSKSSARVRAIDSTAFGNGKPRSDAKAKPSLRELASWRAPARRSPPTQRRAAQRVPPLRRRKRRSIRHLPVCNFPVIPRP